MIYTACGVEFIHMTLQLWQLWSFCPQRILYINYKHKTQVSISKNWISYVEIVTSTCTGHTCELLKLNRRVTTVFKDARDVTSYRFQRGKKKEVERAQWVTCCIFKISNSIRQEAGDTQHIFYLPISHTNPKNCKFLLFCTDVKLDLSY